MHYDVIIIGGSYAGLSAGLQLARARRRILVLDSGLRRNRFAATSHGFFLAATASRLRRLPRTGARSCARIPMCTGPMPR